MNNSEPLAAWQRHEFVGFFHVDLPMESVVNLEDEDSILRVEIPTSPKSEFFLGVFPLPKNAGSSQLNLRGELDRFMRVCFGVNNASFETPVDFDIQGFLAYQAVAELDDEHWLIARAFCRRNGSSLLLVHWNGKTEGIKDLVLPIFVSVVPILDE